MIRAAGASDAGLQRDQNEDRLLVDAARGLFAVIDGVGGHAGGERASAIALDLIGTRLSRETGTPEERLREAIALANNAILDQAQRDPSLSGMTCVLTTAILSGTELTIGHVGDTRLYKLRNGSIQKLTRDHSPVGEREDAGELTEAEAMHHPRRNEVYRDVGAQPHSPDDDGFVDVLTTTLEADAAIVICSDGLSDQVSSASIRRIVEARAGQPHAAAAELIKAANDAGGKDNVTVVIVEGDAFASKYGGRPSPTSHVDAHDAAHAGGRANRAPWWFAAGVLLGAVAAAGALWYVRPDVFRAPSAVPAPVAASGPRTWRVGLDERADVASIGEALAQAEDGDVIDVAAGDYREAITIAHAVTVTGSRDAVVRAPMGAPSGFTALTIDTGGSVTIDGVSIAGSADAPIAIGIRVVRGEVTVRNVSLQGASDAGLVIESDARATLESSLVSDNPGTGIVVRPRASLVARENLVLRNGTVAGHLGPGVQVDAGATATFTANAIGDNGGAAISGLTAPEAIASLVRDNMVRPLPRVTGRRATNARPAPAPQLR